MNGAEDKITAGPLAGKTVDEVMDLMARARELSASDGLDLMARGYRRITEDESRQREASGAEYMGARCEAMAGLFRDADSAACALEGKAVFVDVLRGFRVLSIRHPNPDARNLYAAFGNMGAAVLSERLNTPADVAGELNAPSEIKPTLLTWHELAVRASQILRRDGKAGYSTTGGIAVIGRAAEVRAKLLADLMLQGMAELGVLIAAVGAE